MKQMVLYFLFIFNSNTYSQSINLNKYERLIYAANVDFADKRFENSYKNFSKAFKISKPINSYESLTAAACAYLLGKNKKAKKLIEYSIISQKAPKDFIENFDKFKKIKNETFFTKLLDKHSILESKFYRKLKNPKIFIEIENLLVKDRLVRELEYIDFELNDSIKNKIFNVMLKHTDSLNINKLIDITKSHGYQDNSFILLWHHRGLHNSNNYIWNFFRPIIENEIKNGKLSQSYFCYWDDDLNIQKNGKQIYGSYFSQFDMFPIEDINNVDKRRLEKNLPPLFYLKHIYGIKLPENYKINMNDYYKFIYSDL